MDLANEMDNEKVLKMIKGEGNKKIDFDREIQIWPAI